MSELATQRGSLAVTDAYHRAEAALSMGADLVVSLPFPYSCAAAEYFATAGVSIATALGAGYLHFGSECGDLSRLQSICRATLSPEFTAALTAMQQSSPDLGVMEAREQILSTMLGSTASDCGSNDHLATAYLCAIQRLGSPILPATTRRLGQDYRSEDAPTRDCFASASALRRAWLTSNDLSTLQQQIPDEAYAILQRASNEGMAPVTTDRLTAAMVSFLRLSDPAVLSCYAELGGGVAQRLTRAAWENAPSDVESLISCASTRRFTNARLRRAILYAMCGVTPADLNTPPAYTRLLAMNAKGAAYLSAIKKSCALPLVTKMADLPDTPSAQRQHQLEKRLAALYTLALPRPLDAGYFLRCKPYIAQ
jgi:predicted nucleotidyltransferase